MGVAWHGACLAGAGEEVQKHFLGWRILPGFTVLNSKEAQKLFNEDIVDKEEDPNLEKFNSS